MSLLLQPAAAWLRRRLPWSNSRQAWTERLTGLALLAAVAAVGWFGSRLPGIQQALLWGLLLLVVAFLSRRGWVKLLGPVLFYDLLRTARRRRHVVIRCVYALGLMYTLLFLYLALLADKARPVGEGLFAGGLTSPNFLAELAATFFYVFLGIQFLAVFLLTPAYTAGAVAAEKERQSLDALFATDLRNREIVLSLLLSRLANLGLVLLTGLPILSALEFLGGIDPGLLLAGFAATALTMLSLGSLGILNSVRSARPRKAIMATYFWPLLYLAVSGGPGCCSCRHSSWPTGPRPRTGKAP